MQNPPTRRLWHSREPHRAANDAELRHPRVLKGAIHLKVIGATQYDPNNGLDRPAIYQKQALRLE